MAPRSPRKRPVLNNLLVVGVWLAAGGLAAQLALETRLITSRYEVGVPAVEHIYTAPPETPEPPRQEPGPRRKRMMPPPPQNHLYVETATGEMKTSGSAVYNSGDAIR